MILLHFYSMAPSSSGLGRWPLTPVTRVRTSLGSPSTTIRLSGFSLKAFFLFKKVISNSIPNTYFSISLPAQTVFPRHSFWQYIPSTATMLRLSVGATFCRLVGNAALNLRGGGVPFVPHAKPQSIAKMAKLIPANKRLLKKSGLI